MATARTWIGGGNNRTDNPKDWSPSGVPLIGDSLIMNGGGTMNVVNDISGDNLLTTGTNTINVGRNGNASVGISDGNDDTFNVSQGGVLFARTNGHATVNISGTSKALIANSTGIPGDIINLAQNTNWIGGFGGSFTIKAGKGAVFSNTDTTGSATIPVPVVGIGRFEVTARMEFLSSVSGNQNVVLPGGDTTAVIDQPSNFLATIISSGNGAKIDLLGLPSVDSYSYQNNVLRLYAGNAVVDSLNYNNFEHSFAVTKIGSTVSVLANDPSLLPPGLPIHV